MKDIAMFREVTIPEGVPGRLFLDGMPGRREPLERVWDQVREQGVSAIVCLAGTDEIRRTSPVYAQALAKDTAPCPVIMFAVRDFGVPKDRDAYRRLVGDLATRLVAGGSIMIHCGAGVGRTGSLAACVLLALGCGPGAARRAVSEAGSRPETSGQRRLIAWCTAQDTAAVTPNNGVQTDNASRCR
jgi:protein-tyrosine phosphatase